MNSVDSEGKFDIFKHEDIHVELFHQILPIEIILNGLGIDDLYWPLFPFIY